MHSQKEQEVDIQRIPSDTLHYIMGIPVGGGAIGTFAPPPWAIKLYVSIVICF